MGDESFQVFVLSLVILYVCILEMRKDRFTTRLEDLEHTVRNLSQRLEEHKADEYAMNNFRHQEIQSERPVMPTWTDAPMRA